MHLVGCGRFWLWAVAGALVTFSFVAAASIGLLILRLPPSRRFSSLARRVTRAEPLGSLVGAASICFLIAWLQRPPGGFESRPWFGAGIFLAAAGIAGYALLTRRVAPPA